MTLERYVAICMPLRHGELCSTLRALHCILIIHGLSFVPCLVFLSIFFASASRSFYTQARGPRPPSAEKFLLAGPYRCMPVRPGTQELTASTALPRDMIMSENHEYQATWDAG
ncbi:hypothetical protein Q8A73_006988 [Channa argus]|nr:hypothetical protein Q8A73_006988 [Channa argus]